MTTTVTHHTPSPLPDVATYYTMSLSSAESSSTTHTHKPKISDLSISEHSNDKFNKQNIEFGDMLGEGAYARVFHARLKSTNEEFAIKMMEKKHIIRHQKEAFVFNEKNVLSKLNHPNLMRLHATFQDNIALYFVLDLCPGGELFQQVKRAGKCSLDVTKFYIAEVVLALEYLNQQKIVHRDLSKYFTKKIEH
jgi:3-phosphoinositide dependent protein kinase-1